jgi:hypothetical protein
MATQRIARLEIVWPVGESLTSFEVQRLIIESGTAEQLTLRFRVERSAGKDANKAEVVALNLSAETRAQLQRARARVEASAPLSRRRDLCRPKTRRHGDRDHLAAARRRARCGACARRREF